MLVVAHPLNLMPQIVIQSQENDPIKRQISMPQLEVWQAVLVLTCAIFAIMLLFSWWFLFQRSVWRIVFLFLSLILGRGVKKFDEPIQTAPKKPRLRDAMGEDVAHLMQREPRPDAPPQQGFGAQTYKDTLADNAPKAPSAPYYTSGNAPQGAKRPFRYLRLFNPDKNKPKT